MQPLASNLGAQFTQPPRVGELARTPPDPYSLGRLVRVRDASLVFLVGGVYRLATTGITFTFPITLTLTLAGFCGTLITTYLLHVNPSLLSEFDSHKPDAEQINEITSYMSGHINAASTDGWKVGELILHLTPNGGDIVSYEEFNPDGKTEWCLLSRGDGHHFDFITADIAQRLIETGKTLISRAPLVAKDFIRGSALVELLKGSATVCKKTD